MTANEFIIVGSGIGGIAAAMRLAAHGHAVTVLEKEGVVGGKMRAIEVCGRQIDCGPTVVTMREVFEELFDDCGLKLSDFVRLARAEIIARHAWDESGVLDFHADRRQTEDAIGRFCGRAAAHGFRSFSDHAQRVFETMWPIFMRAEKPSPLGMVRDAGLTGLRGLISSAPFTTYWDCLGEHFKDPRLRQLFGRYATYCGSSPYESPATLAVIAHVEQRGVWIIDGGIRTLATGLRQAAERVGVKFKTDSNVTEVLLQGSRAAGVRLSTGEQLNAKALLMNCDAAAIAAGHFGSSVRAAVSTDATLPRSLSAATWAIVARTDNGFPLSHHSVFFSTSSEAEFSDLFKRNRPPDDPTVYVCAQDRGMSAPPPDSSERLFVIVNAPADGGRSLATPESIERCENAMLRTLERCGLRMKVEEKIHIGPATFASRYPASSGALYGMATHGWNASFRRATVRTKIPGLYLAGGSVHPGAGLPMAALSGMAAAHAMLMDARST